MMSNSQKCIKILGVSETSGDGSQEVAQNEGLDGISFVESVSGACQNIRGLVE